MIDANALKSGKDFEKLRDTYVIFITENDVMKRGQEVYVYDRTERASGDRLHDGAHIIYVNGATRSDTEIGKLVHDLLCRDAAKMHFDLLKKRVSQFKNSEEGRRIMCKAMEDFGNRRMLRPFACAGQETPGVDGVRKEMGMSAANSLILQGGVIIA